MDMGGGEIQTTINQNSPLLPASMSLWLGEGWHGIKKCLEAKG
jgi:hypothetical protein